MKYSRNDLIFSDASANQMRNSIYHLERFMAQNGYEVLEIKERLRRMGKNIAKTFFNYWRPVDIVTLRNVKDVISTIYQKIVNSSVIINIDVSQNLIKIKDNKCALCKYHYDDINIAGCEILLGLISELIFLIGKDSKDISSIYLEPYEVEESRALGNDSCLHVFKFKIEGG